MLGYSALPEVAAPKDRVHIWDRSTQTNRVMAGSFETVVMPEQQAQPRVWLSFRRASVYKQNDGLVVVIDWTPAASRNRELQWPLRENSL